MEGGKLKSGVVGVGHEPRVNTLREGDHFASVPQSLRAIEASRGGG